MPSFKYVIEMSYTDRATLNDIISKGTSSARTMFLNRITINILLCVWVRSRCDFLPISVAVFVQRKTVGFMRTINIIRNGTACIFLFTEPLWDWRYTDSQKKRTRQDLAKQIDWLFTKQNPTAEKSFW